MAVYLSGDRPREEARGGNGEAVQFSEIIGRTFIGGAGEVTGHGFQSLD